MSSMIRLRVSARCVTAALASLFFSVESAQAHVRLDAPDGGEVLRAGSTFTIEWSVLVRHATQNWDLWYSTTGPNGPWLPIVMDLPPGDIDRNARHSYAWTVPDVESTRVRIRVRQDNAAEDYYDVSANDLSILPSLTASPATISLAAGGTQQLTLEAGAANQGSAYLVIGSVTGTSPGFRLGSVTVPLVVDGYTVHTAFTPNTPPLTSSAGVLSASGAATASFTLPAGLASSLIGVKLYHAYVTFDGAIAVRMASNPVVVTLIQ